MNFKMTPRAALAKQAEHIAHYSTYRANLAAEVAAKTNIVGIDLDAEMSITEINRRIPRGGAIESMCGLNFGGN